MEERRTSVQRTWLRSGFDRQRNFIRFSHHVFERFVDLIEHFRFGRQLTLDVRGAEDRFEVLPRLLTFRPGVERFAEQIEIRLPFFDTRFDRTDVPRTGDRGDVDVRIVEQLNDVIRAADNVNIFVIFVRNDRKFDGFPRLFDLRKRKVRRAKEDDVDRLTRLRMPSRLASELA